HAESQKNSKTKKPKYYSLIEFPYPSGAGMHVGHIRSNTAMDVISRKRRMEGFNVLYPIGWDAFGLPTENYAIKTGIHPTKVTKTNTDTFRRQLKALGFSFDWSREINTTDPKYYKWTQWIFLQFFKKGLAYKKKMAINWCPKDKIGLANEEVVDGCCERCGTAVEKRDKEQWMLAITKYAERLDKDLDTVDYLEKIKIQQRNWIGKSQGVNFKCKVKDLGIAVEMYNSVPQTFRAETFTVIAPEHHLVRKLVAGTKYEKSVLDFVEQLNKKRAQKDFDADKEMEGIFTGRYIENFAGSGRDLPIWIASYVVADYGTGIVNASTHDTRDFAFAKKFKIPLHPVMFPQDEVEAQKVRNDEYSYAKDPQAVLAEPLEFKGRHWGEAREDIINFIEKNGWGERKTNFKLRDWVFSRQRYWGEPIPLINCPTCGWVPVPEKDLPVKLPNVKNYQPTDTGESPLAAMTKWVNVKCPQCKGKAKRETDTMPNWAGSSWYYLRYADPKNSKAFASEENLKYFTPVDWYNGGMEHTTLHLLYSRFWHKFLYDLKLVPTSEPYMKRTSHGLILADDGTKFSKSKGNGIDPQDIVKVYGADSLRLYEMFMGPFDQAVSWSNDGMVGPRRFIEKVWRIGNKLNLPPSPLPYQGGGMPSPGKGRVGEGFEVNKLLHKTIKKVTEDIEAMRFNTAISSMMILATEMDKVESVSGVDFKMFLQILAPFAPHVSEELWSTLGEKKSIHLSTWPKFDENLIKDDEVKIAVQVNGKVRAEIMIGADEGEESVKEKALQNELILKHISGANIKKVIYVKNRLISIVL
ncbi:MAG: leucine--tRNA ligase, partial [bacterium]